MTFQRGFRGAALLVAFVMTASTVNGQVISTRPFRSIFKTTQDPANSKHRVDAAVFVSAGHDDAETTTGAFGSAPDPVPSTASYGNVFARGTYAHDGRKIDFSASGSASTRYYDATQGFTPMWTGGDARVSGEVSRHGRVSAAQSISYSPYYVFSLTPGFLEELSVDAPETAPPTFDPETDLRSSRRSTTSYRSSGQYTHRLGRRTYVTAHYEFNYVDSAAPVFDLMAHRGRARIRRELGRYWNVYAGYGPRMSTYRNSAFDDVIVHDFDGGVAFNRALPFSARTRVGFTVSSALVSQAEATSFRINGTAHLSHVFTRNWVASGYYRRDNDVLHGFAAPFVTFSDAVGFMASGKVAGPVYVSGIGSYARGTFSVLTAENVVTTTTATARVNVPIMWLLSTYVEGYYAHYDFERRIGLLPGVPTTTDRVGIRAGVTFWVPVLR